ncbi:MAG: D-amino acid aminotransferase [Ruminococcaceae bacterium]|nr:D-amino acid aminotransferase [Oscillospiraceae bacterium]
MDSYAYYNGRFSKAEDMKISLSDRAIFFGDAVYDAAIGRYEFIMWESEHIDRLLNNAKRLGIEHNYTKEFIISLLQEIAIKSCIPEYFIYLQISRSKSHRTHSALGSSANLLVTIEPIKICRAPMNLTLFEDLRYGYCDIKTVNLLPAVLASTKAEINGYDEAVFVKDGIITECAKSNISILKNGVLKTHPTDNKILPGITRAHLLIACENLGIKAVEESFTQEELFSADEVLVSSTTKLVRRARMIDAIDVGMKDSKKAEKICQYLYDEFENLGKI